MIALRIADAYAPRFLGFIQRWRWDTSGLLGRTECRGWSLRVWRFVLVVTEVER